MPAYEFEGVRPVVDPTAFVHPTAVLIGDVVIGPKCLVAPNAVLRGDIGRIVMEEGANIQDTCVVHCFPNKETIIGAGGHVGHGAVLHGCRIGTNALVGMNAVIMDDAVIGEEAFVAAMTFVKPGTEVPPRHLIAGVPGKVIRELRDDEVAWKTRGTEVYQHLAQRHGATGVEIEPLTAIEPDRPELPAIDYTAKHDST
jgi:phenylacetic acid degradation protein